jgi:N-acetylmuramoyl-L-alanine amidase
MIPIKDFIPVGRNNRPGIKLKGPLFITIHDTANTDKGADALMHAKYLKGDAAAARPASWHFTVDCIRVVQNLLLDEASWNAGDGHGAGNLSSISIEICENADGDRIKAEANAAALVADLMEQLKIPLENVVQHNHWSGKNCPHIIRARPNGWENFIQEVKANMGYKMSAVDANRVISLLAGAYGATADKEAQAEYHRLANELRKVSGQSVQ